MPHTVVIADDITGANDIGIMYAKQGHTVLVYSLGKGEKISYQDCDVLIIDTDSRFDTGETAYTKVRTALEHIPKDGVEQYFSKQCSVFRGNIGAEFDAMLDELEEEFAVVVLGFPGNGRTTLHGRHYIYGTPLQDSQFRLDPVHPMTESDLILILQAQTKRKVGAIHYESYEAGEEALRVQIKKAKQEYQYCILDVRDNQDLKLMASVLRGERVICGSSALAEYLAPFHPKSTRVSSARQKGEKVLCTAGSLTPQTLAQIGYMKEKGYPVGELDTRKLFSSEEKEAEIQRLESLIREAYEKGNFAMVHSMNSPHLVEETKKKALDSGYDNREVSSLVSSVLSEIAWRAIREYQIRNIIVCGGDTSASLCARLKIRGMQVLEEIETGLPTCESVDAPHYRMVLKSGSFGSPGFIEKSIKVLTGGGDQL